MSESLKLKSTADKIIAYLKSKGVVIQRYDSMTSNSIYLKFDYGVANTLRISDHHGKSHLAYRYNLLTNIKDYYEDRDGQYPKFYYPLSEGNKLLVDILTNRQAKIKQWGEEKYKGYMISNMEKGVTQEKGFWKQSKFV